jgi:DNA-binding SARP family transcriptional activator
VRAEPAGTAPANLALQVLASYPYGIVVVRRDGRVIAHNPAAARLMGALAERLSDPDDRAVGDILDARLDGSGAEGRSLIDRALEQRAVLPEVRVDLPPGADARAVWVTVAPLDESGDCVTVELRPGRVNDRRRRTAPDPAGAPRLRIQAFGRTRVESTEGAIGGPWVAHRAGQVLKYLVAAGDRVVHPEEILEALWQDAHARSVPGVRYYIHQLRQRLEPERSGRGESSFVASVPGGYVLRRDAVAIDVDDFERSVQTGHAAVAAGDADRACRAFERGLALYGGDFLADEPYAEWAIAERDRLRSVAADSLRALADLRIAAGDLAGAAAHLEHLAVLEPYDEDVHRGLIALALRRGRRTEAVRRYNALRRKMMTTFGEDLGFTLADVTAT